jgi:penicillin-binding protein 1A
LGKQEVGGRAAAPVWLYFMEKALQNTPAEVFPVPTGIVFSRVDRDTGLPEKRSSVNTIYECFLEGTIPGGGMPVDAAEISGVMRQGDAGSPGNY